MRLLSKVEMRHDCLPHPQENQNEQPFTTVSSCVRVMKIEHKL